MKFEKLVHDKKFRILFRGDSQNSRYIRQNCKGLYRKINKSLSRKLIASLLVIESIDSIIQL